MSGFIEGENRYQSTVFPERVDDYVAEDSPVRVIDVFIDRLDISGLGFKAEPADTGRPGQSRRIVMRERPARRKATGDNPLPWQV